jgi:tellurite resistance protein
MGLRPETEWLLTACALIAHADGVLDGEECDRLLGMIDERLEGDEYSEWLALMGDRELLERHLSKLPVPPRESHRELLEQAWTMAMVDGERCEAELEALGAIAARLGVDAVQLDYWRETWTYGERALAEGAAASAAFVLRADGPGGEGDKALFATFVDQLPTVDAHRHELRAVLEAPPQKHDVVRMLGALSRRTRIMVLRLVARLAVRWSGSEAATVRFQDLAQTAGVGAADVDAILEDARKRGRS